MKLPSNIHLRFGDKENSSSTQFFESMNSGNTEGFGTDEWLTTEGAAAFLKVSPHYLRNLTSNGQLPYHKLQSRNRYRKSDLVNLLMSTRKGGTHGI